jgi:hypothetical protein
MKVQKARRLNKTDFPDAPEWIDQILQVLNTQFERWVTLFNGNITHQDNIRDEIAKIDLMHDTTLPVKLNVLKRNPIGVKFLGSNYFEYSRMTWEMSEDPLTVNVKVKWDVPPDGEVRCTLLFIGS